MVSASEDISGSSEDIISGSSSEDISGSSSEDISGSLEDISGSASVALEGRSGYTHEGNLFDIGVMGLFDELSQIDLISAHLLRIACTAKTTFAKNLSVIASELHKIGVLSKSAMDIVTDPTELYNRSLFANIMDESQEALFWKPILDLGQARSRYLADFIPLEYIGRGGFGYVVLFQHKLDGQQYAIKKIRLPDKYFVGDAFPQASDILTEVGILSMLQHQHVVRYYQSWCELGDDEPFDISESSGESTGNSGDGNKFFLHISMEYCPSTLKMHLQGPDIVDNVSKCRFFQQIVEGVAYIHGHGIVHQDLNPNNIFVDSNLAIKIGDFGLAKFQNLDQTFPSNSASGGFGTVLYQAPEVEQNRTMINDKSDIYSLGVILFELWHPFDTESERASVLLSLKKDKTLPHAWVEKFPKQASLVRRLMADSPSERPTATELVQILEGGFGDE